MWSVAQRLICVFAFSLVVFLTRRRFWVVVKLLENFLLVGKLSSKNAKLGDETLPHFGEINQNF